MPFNVKKMYINGEWVNSQADQSREILNPATGEVIAVVAEGTVEDVKHAIHSARKAFDEGPWRSFSAQDRASLLLQISSLIDEHKEELAKLETMNNGKPLREALSDVETASDAFRYYAGLVRTSLGETFDSTIDSIVIQEPIGVCTQIVPWNFPLQMAAWKLAPCLAAGNVSVFKPAETTPLSAIRLFELMSELDIPPGVVNLVLGAGRVIGNELTSNEHVDKVSFTGGTVTGKKIMANSIETMKKVTLELGGKSPVVVFSDVNIDTTVEYALFGIFLGAGQVCSAGSRILVHEDIYQEFIGKMTAHAEQIVVGNGLDEGVEMGPVASEAHMHKVLDFIQTGEREGATLATGGKRIVEGNYGKGYFIEPTIFTNVSNNMSVVQEEIFGPVVTVQTFSSEEEAVRLANSTKYGLAGAVFTNDFSRALRVTKSMKAGTVWINKYHSVNNQLPWGGFKQSGFGRDLGKNSLLEYTETKVVNMNIHSSAVGFYKSFSDNS
ncbi:betaine aldehyde dehydrogenase [Siminovitchia terrae]|uniref:aldehyde dehydrogenase family protein n=1 Tax=Siminovitchia terrae TaxID=1914933 RepID=UPI001B0542FB|nr:aldehyde dehydrogenase family protein [Siminovitchia terrae]GIN90421.1 betaine aldehyde dehydrogenase [Siminovitchia terrae]